MNINLARLRKAAAEGGDTGSPEARDRLIEVFLEEVSRVVSGGVVDALSDGELRTLYVKWVRAINADTTEEQRATWLISGVIVSPQLYHLYEPTSEREASPPNVVSIARR